MAIKKRLILKVPYKSGWILISNDTMEIKAHTNKFSDIVAKSEKLDPSRHAIMAAAASYHGYL